jgi:hypothetical protein
MDDIAFEASPEDVAEQRAEVVPADLDDGLQASGLQASALQASGAGPAVGPADAPWDADPADLAEQRAEVPLDEEDWA